MFPMKEKSEMKKMIVLTALLAVAFAGVAQADIQVTWIGALGFYNHDVVGAPAVPGDYILNEGGSAPAYLIWSPNNVIDSLFGLPAIPGVVAATGDDIILATFNGANSPFGDYDAGTAVYTDLAFGETLATGYIYARIFEDALADGVYYNDGPIVSAAGYAFTGSEPPVLYDHNQGDDPVNGGQCTEQLTVVPEPSTILLSILGLGVIMVRRFRK